MRRTVEPATLRLSPEQSRESAISRIAQALASAGLEEPRREARLLTLAILAIPTAELVLHPETTLGTDADRLAAAATRRIAREPHARITGTREFFGLDIVLNAATLIPRPETEILVEATLAHAKKRGLDKQPARIIDLGTGSGAILCALLSELPHGSGVGVDLSSEALAAARINLETHVGKDRATLVLSNWFGKVEGRFEIIVSNPPYIPGAEIAGLEPEVAHHDPRLALDGGTDGLDAYRVLASTISSSLAIGGFAALELGAGQAQSVSAMVVDAGMHILELRQDLAGIDRVLVIAN